MVGQPSSRPGTELSGSWRFRACFLEPKHDVQLLLEGRFGALQIGACVRVYWAPCGLSVQGVTQVWQPAAANVHDLCGQASLLSQQCVLLGVQYVPMAIMIP